MIGPRYEYGKYTGGSIDNSKVPRQPGNLDILEKTISKVMVNNYQQQLQGALTDISPIVYADCSIKGEKEIMFFLMEQLLGRQKPENADEIVRKVIAQSSMLDDDQKAQLKTISGDILPHYYAMFDQLLQKYENDDQKKTVKKFEIDVAVRVMGKILKES
ncbi:hypothetical protein KBC03_02255 [Patescibacteria group bacterium]|nr:hypothetical protein [Patescibacteria group bacterium]